MNSKDIRSMLSRRLKYLTRRKRRLLIVAICRLNFSHKDIELTAMKVAEQMADDKSFTLEELQSYQGLGGHLGGYLQMKWPLVFALTPHFYCHYGHELSLHNLIRVATFWVAHVQPRHRGREYLKVAGAVVDLLFPSKNFRCELLPGQKTPDVQALAQAAYDDRPHGRLDNERLCVLADALEEVGAHERLTSHLRANGPHFLGCWALDKILEKK